MSLTSTLTWFPWNFISLKSNAPIFKYIYYVSSKVDPLVPRYRLKCRDRHLHTQTDREKIKFGGPSILDKVVVCLFLGHEAHKVGANLQFPWCLEDRWFSPYPGQDVSLSLETSPVKLVPIYTWVEWGNGGELSFPRIKLAAQTPGIEP